MSKRVLVLLMMTAALAALTAPVYAQTSTTEARATDSNPNTAAPGAPDPRAYLDDINGDKAMAWVKAHNDKTLTRLSSDPRFAQNQAVALKILQNNDRIALPDFARHGRIDNVWQDAKHPQGVWRRATWASYRSGKPVWKTILDIDALSKVEGKNWVFQGSQCLPPDETDCLIELSNGGTDASVIREFDTTTRTFVANGFVLPEGKQNVTWVDKDTLYVSREWQPGQLTASGYAYVTKSLKRGQSLD